MSSRVLLGNHSTYGYGLYISKPSVEVTGANRNDFLFSSEAASNGQILFTAYHTISVGIGTKLTRKFLNHGGNCFGTFQARVNSLSENTFGVRYISFTDPVSNYIDFTITENSSTESTYEITNYSPAYAFRCVITIWVQDPG
jgi:hypothetical protein